MLNLDKSLEYKRKLNDVLLRSVLHWKFIICLLTELDSLKKEQTIKKTKCFLVFLLKAACRWILRQLPVKGFSRTKIRLIEGNAKCRQLKKLACKVTLRQVFYLSETQNPVPPTLTHCTSVYNVLIHTGKGGGGGGRWTREKGNSSQSWVENATMTEYLRSINSDKHLPQSHLAGQFF